MKRFQFFITLFLIITINSLIAQEKPKQQSKRASAFTAPLKLGVASILLASEFFFHYCTYGNLLEGPDKAAVLQYRQIIRNKIPAFQLIRILSYAYRAYVIYTISKAGLQDAARLFNIKNAENDIQILEVPAVHIGLLKIGIAFFGSFLPARLKGQAHDLLDSQERSCCKIGSRVLDQFTLMNYINLASSGILFLFACYRGCSGVAEIYKAVRNRFIEKNQAAHKENKVLDAI